MPDTRLTAVRHAQIRHNETQVRAEAALRAERVIAWVRVCLGLGIAVAALLGRLLEGDTTGDPVRAAGSTLFILSALTVALVLPRVKATPRRQFYGPLVTIALDAGFAAFMLTRVIAQERALEMALPVGLGCVFIAYSLFRFSVLHSLVSTAAALGVVGLCVVYGAAVGVPMHPLGVAFGVVFLVAMGFLTASANRVVRRMFAELRQRENLARFLPRQVAERVLSLSGAPLEPVQREVTILFVDVRDFTSLSEHMPPRDVLAFLNELLGALSQIVQGRDGVVNKFLGDGMLAVWGVPEHDPDHAGHAVRAALDMITRVEELNQGRVAEGSAPIRIGVGIHTGQVAAGMIGGADQHEYTVIGDAVNLASRLEGLTKTYGCSIVVSETTAALVEGRFTLRALADAQVKGRVQGVKVFAVDAPAPAPAPALAATGT